MLWKTQFWTCNAN